MPSDYGHELTDKEIGELEARIREIYKQARDELQNTVDAYFESFWERDSEMRKRLDAGEITENDYQQWRLAQIGRGERFEALRDTVAERYTYANEVAVSYINDKTPGIYSLNHNYMAYTIEQVAGDIGFTLLDEQTVRRLISEAPDLMPHYPALRAIERGIDLAWGKKQITAAVTSGILQGNGLKQVADDLQKRIQTMERDSALRSARTALTGAECAGRQDSLSVAKKRGISVKKEWLSVADSRTRHAHAVLDGQKADVDKPFKVDGQEIMYPGDPHAKGELVYNCRCTLVGDLQGVREKDPAMRRARNPETGENELVQDMTYAEWEASKRAEQILRKAKDTYGTGLTMSAADGILNENDIYALYQYKSSGVAYSLNSMLRGEAPLTARYREIARNVDIALTKLPQYEGIVYRSLRSAEMVDVEAFWKKYTPGSAIIETSFISTSTEVYDETMDIQMIIRSKRGRDMRKYNELEQEILFPRGTMFRVIKREGNTLWLEEI